MTNSRPDIVEVLENERDWHKEQIRRIDLALDVLKGKPIEEVQQRKTDDTTIRWAKEISELFNEFNDLTLKEVRERLAERGILKALEKHTVPIIYSTLKRKIKQGEFEKIENGRYRKKRKSRRRIDFELPENKKDSAPHMDGAESKDETGDVPERLKGPNL